MTTWGLSKDLFSPAVAVVGIFTIAAVKVSYVMLDFMELRAGTDPGTCRLPGLASGRGGDDPGLLVRYLTEPPITYERIGSKQLQCLSALYPQPNQCAELGDAFLAHASKRRAKCALSGEACIARVREDGDEATRCPHAEPQRDWVRFVQPKGASRRTGVAMGLYAAERGSRVIRAMWTRALSVAMITPLFPLVPSAPRLLEPPRPQRLCAPPPLLRWQPLRPDRVARAWSPSRVHRPDCALWWPRCRLPRRRRW